MFEKAIDLQLWIPMLAFEPQLQLLEYNPLSIAIVVDLAMLFNL